MSSPTKKAPLPAKSVRGKAVPAAAPRRAPAARATAAAKKAIQPAPAPGAAARKPGTPTAKGARTPKPPGAPARSAPKPAPARKAKATTPPAITKKPAAPSRAAASAPPRPSTKPVRTESTAAKRRTPAPTPKGREAKLERSGKPAAAPVVTPTSPVIAPVPQAPPGEGARQAKAPRRARPARIPPILLEGDDSPGPSVSGPGERFALGPLRPAAAPKAGDAGESLPATYGTRQLWLAARDPHWLYAGWDFRSEDLEQFESRAAAGHLALRIYEEAVAGAPLLEVLLAKGARCWFVHVGRGGTRFVAQLGYAEQGGGWQTIAHSNDVQTPVDRPASETAVEFATIPVDVPFGAILGKVAEAVRESEPLVQILDQLRAEGFEGLPGPAEVRQPEWTRAQERALAEVLRIDVNRRVWVSSLDVTQVVLEKLAGAAPGPGAGPTERPTSPTAAFGAGVEGGVSSPTGGAGERARPRGFWFNINAELVVYGATEPDATLTIAGRSLRLRPDGSFSLRFALPDGDYELPVEARSRTGDDARSAVLRFMRHTGYEGAVGTHPQDPRLQPPKGDTVTAGATAAGA